MNERAGREKYFYLHRRRTFYAPDSRWMGRERKRGALMDLNCLLLGRAGAQNAFAAEGEACAALAGRFSMVLTLDADTRLAPGSVHALAGTLAASRQPSPARKTACAAAIAVLQPNMELAASSCTNEFVRLFAGRGGMDAYPVTVSNLYQDLAARAVSAARASMMCARLWRRWKENCPRGVCSATI